MNANKCKPIQTYLRKCKQMQEIIKANASNSKPGVSKAQSSKEKPQKSGLPEPTSATSTTEKGSVTGGLSVAGLLAFHERCVCFQGCTDCSHSTPRRFELFLMVHFWGSGFGDHSPPHMHLDDIPKSYAEYFRKKLAIHKYGFRACSQLALIISDTVEIKDDYVYLMPQLDASTDIGHFVRLSESLWRNRLRRIKAGDESAVLHFRT